MQAETYEVRRPFMSRGRRFRVGETFKGALFTPEKLAQFVGQRMIRSTAILPLVATRSFTLGGQRFDVGDAFSTEGLGTEKVRQLLEHRYIQPLAQPGGAE